MAVNQPSQQTTRVICTTESPDGTISLGRQIGCHLDGDLTIGLIGPLGAGKTQLVKGLAQGNDGDKALVTSPTFSLIHEYPGRIPLIHIDTYRLKDPVRELRAMGLEEYFERDAAMVVEWADRVADLMPPDTLWIEIESRGSSGRRFHLHTASARLGWLGGIAPRETETD